MIVIACPGQGSQTPGFLKPWLADPQTAQWLESVAAQIGTDLILHGTESDADTIRDTAIAQPLIVAAGILTIQRLQAELTAAAAQPQHAAHVAAIREKLIFAGHSVGEITAAYGAGVFSAEDAMQFVAARAAAMQECASESNTSMAAVLGGAEEEITAKLSELELSPANFNGGGQLVVGGAESAIDELVTNPPARARVIKLQVAGAFHTAAMEPARTKLATAKSNFTVSDAKYPLLTNKDGSTVSVGAEYLDLLVGQVASPVRWDLCMESLLTAGATQLVEAAPSGALVGLAKRGMRGVTAHKINTPADVTALVETFLEQEATATAAA